MKTLVPPRQPAPDAATDWPDGELIERESYADLDLVDPPFGHARRVSLDVVRIRDGAMAGLGLEDWSMDDVVLVNCDLSNVDLSRLSARRVQLQGCRWAGLKLGGARFEEVLFRDCQGPYVVFEGAVFKRVRFERCALVDANFDRATTGSFSASAISSGCWSSTSRARPSRAPSSRTWTSVGRCWRRRGCSWGSCAGR